MNKFLIVFKVSIFVIFQSLLTSCNTKPLDQIAPEVSLIVSKSLITSSTEVMLTANASDNDKIARVEFYEDNKRIGEVLAFPYTFKVKLTSLNNGTRNYTVKAIDPSGNSTISAVSPVSVDINVGFFQYGVSALDLILVRNAVTSTESLDLDSNNNPIVVWHEWYATGTKLYVKKWNGLSWIQLGTLPLDVGVDERERGFSIQIDSKNNPIVAWLEGTNSTDVFVKRWNGVSWIQLGSNLDIFSNANPTTISMTIDKNDMPIVAWNEFDGQSSNVYVKRWDGSSWVQLGDAPLDIVLGKSAYLPSIVIDSKNSPIISWSESNSTDTAMQVFVKRWNGTAWQQIGDSFLNIDGEKGVTSSSIAMNSKDQPFVTWGEAQSGSATKIYVKAWNGAIWQQVGEALNTEVEAWAINATIEVDANDSPIVAWQDNKIRVKQWNGQAWETLNLSQIEMSSTNSGIFPSIALDSFGFPSIIWSESDGTSNNVYVKKFNR